MRFGLQEDVIAKINSVFANNGHVEKVLLFGSRSKGTNKPDSDIDLTMLGKHLDTNDFNQINEELQNLLLPYEIDLSIFDRIDNELLKASILDRDVVFYDKKE